MPQEIRFRKQQSVIWTGNNSKMVVPLSRGMIYREIMLRLQGSPTLTGVNNTRANTLIGDEWGCVKRIDIVANGTDVLRTFSGDDLWWLNRYYYGLNPRVSPTIGDGSTANPSFDSTLLIPFWSPRSVKPLDTALDSRELSDLRLEITWGTFTDVNSAATAWTTNPSLEVASYESFGVDGPFSLKRVFKQIAQPSAANTAYRVDLPVGPQYRGLLINTKNSANTTDSSSIITNIKLVSGSTVFVDLSENMMFQYASIKNDLTFNITRATATGIQYQIDPKASTASVERSWYMLDLVGDGFLTEAIDTYGLSEFYLEFNVTGAGSINILPTQIIPVRK